MIAFVSPYVLDLDEPPDAASDGMLPALWFGLLGLLWAWPVAVAVTL